MKHTRQQLLMLHRSCQSSRCQQDMRRNSQLRQARIAALGKVSTAQSLDYSIVDEFRSDSRIPTDGKHTGYIIAGSRTASEADVVDEVSSNAALRYTVDYTKERDTSGR